jgi:hypothetical protein
VQALLDGRPGCIVQAASPGYEACRTGRHCAIARAGAG